MRPNKYGGSRVTRSATWISNGRTGDEFCEESGIENNQFTAVAWKVRRLQHSIPEQDAGWHAQRLGDGRGSFPFSPRPSSETQGVPPYRKGWAGACRIASSLRGG